VISYNGGTKTFYLRKQTSIKALYTFINSWESYTRLFTVQSGLDESNGNGDGQFHNFNNKYKNPYERYGEAVDKEEIDINFLTIDQQAAIFSWKDRRTLAQIEQMTGYKVKPRGVVSQFKHGGFIVYEKNGYGLVASLFDIGDYKWEDAKNVCDKFELSGYSDWYLPTIKELELINNTLNKEKLGAIKDYYSYWSKDENKNDNYYAWSFIFKENYLESEPYEGSSNSYGKKDKKHVRAVRAF
jgi:hypothetical protein